MFYAFICIFTPACLATSILNTISKKERKDSSLIFTYFVFLMFITLGTLAIFNIFFDYGYSFVDMNVFTNSFSIRYLLISILQAIIYPFIYEIFARTLEIKIEIEKKESVDKGSRKNETKNKKHN